MVDDVVSRVAEAIKPHLSPWRVGTSDREDEALYATAEAQARAAIDAHTAWLVEQGKVTPEAVWVVLGVHYDEYAEGVYALLTRAVAVACAEKDAEVATWTENAIDRQDKWKAAEDEIERLRATIARVEALCDDVIDGSGVTALVRAALAGGDA
jgi:hypothetical protein